MQLQQEDPIWKHAESLLLLCGCEAGFCATDVCDEAAQTAASLRNLYRTNWAQGVQALVCANRVFVSLIHRHKSDFQNLSELRLWSVMPIADPTSLLCLHPSPPHHVWLCKYWALIILQTALRPTEVKCGGAHLLTNKLSSAFLFLPPGPPCF